MRHSLPLRSPGRRRVERPRREWPTLAIAAIIYSGWLALTGWHAVLPVPVVIVAGAWLVAWHGSLQHETIHGHPTSRPWVNAAIGLPPLSLWLPYAIYRRSHIAHHGCQRITDPLHDPESRYLASDAAPWRWAARAQAALIGRLALGPAFAIVALLREEASRAVREPRTTATDWTLHLLTVAPICAWLEWTGFGVLRYLLFVVYPGTALTLLRSFAEHRADIPGDSRAATVESSGPFALLFLNNNLHTAHHERPDIAWYRLPAYHRLHRQRLKAQAGDPYQGYREIVRRFALAPHDVLIHPDAEGGQ